MSFLLFLVSCAVCTAIMCVADWNGDLLMKAKAKWYCLLQLWFGEGCIEGLQAFMASMFLTSWHFLQVSDCAKSCLLLRQHFLAITLRGVR
ncbi:hypothetical protein NC651_003802 [Populus alba x Populus x berolinensis]|nr:hypothetical protein NC651_003802 [Populus alba x Populus x berolinensis]